MSSRIAAASIAMMVALTPIAAADADHVVIKPDRYSPKLVIGAERDIAHTNHVRPKSKKRAWPPGQYLCVQNPTTGLYKCMLQTDPAGAVLTEGDVLRAVREIGLPSLQVQLQPGTSTLVNVPTIFYTRPEAFRRSVTLLGFNVDLIADPVRYRWLHGDGTATTTTRPGKPYPSTEVTYRYRQPAEAINPRVDVTYRVRYRVDGGAWNTINQTLLASGPTTDLEVKEAAPVLTHP